MAEHNELGKWGEQVAVDFLRKQGYAILGRNWRSGHRDIDIIAKDGDMVVFVEVKTRRNNDFGEPIEAVDYHKLRNLRIAINHYIKHYEIDNEVRLDVVSIVGVKGQTPRIDHFVDVSIY